MFCFVNYKFAFVGNSLTGGLAFSLLFLPGFFLALCLISVLLFSSSYGRTNILKTELFVVLLGQELMKLVAWNSIRLLYKRKPLIRVASRNTVLNEKRKLLAD